MAARTFRHAWSPVAAIYGGTVHFEERPIPVPAALRPWISDVSVATLGALAGEQTVAEAPDHATALVLRVTPGEYSDLVVTGPRTRALYHAGKPGPFCVRARIQPGRARLLLGQSVKGLLNRAVSLSDLWGEPGEHLSRMLAEAGSDPATIAQRLPLQRIEQALLGRVLVQETGDRSRSDLAYRAALLLAGDDGAAATGPEPVAATAARLNVSERHLRNLFTEAAGISPKHFARLARLGTVVAHAGNMRWAQLAAEAGYYDQSHMNAEFRRLMGVPPGAYTASRVPAASPCSLHRPG